jgi:hypothetical protein
MSFVATVAALALPSPYKFWCAGFFLALAAYCLVQAIRVRRRPSSLPRVILHGTDAFHVKKVAWGQGPGAFVTDVLSVRFINAPLIKAESAISKRLGGSFTCEGTGLPWIDARFDSSPQPKPGDVPELRRDLGVDEWSQFNLIIKESDSEYCYLFNNPLGGSAGSQSRSCGSASPALRPESKGLSGWSRSRERRCSSREGPPCQRRCSTSLPTRRQRDQYCNPVSRRIGTHTDHHRS